MGFFVAMSVVGLIAASLLLGFLAGGLNERERDGVEPAEIEKTESGVGQRRPLLGTTVGLLSVVVGCGLQIVDPSILSPLWLQYSLFALLPALAGYVARRMLEARLAKQAQQ